MEELLPDITINSKINARIFLKRLSHTVKENLEISEKIYEKDYIEIGEDSLVIRPLKCNGNKNLSVLLFNIHNLDIKVFVELAADKWEIEPATYDLYANEAKRILSPILRKYNKEYQSRIRLSIQTKENLKIKLPKVAEELFYKFYSCIHKKSLHPVHWRRFHRFVWHCQVRGVKLNSEGLDRLLIDKNFDSGTARTLAENYRIIGHFLDTIRH